ncbi:MAG: selenocysteine-specific translation elongation factor [Chloroflexi bacterium]|nr:selenocysteine-specific translation elongation factor [Chloroflexota bacterium]MBC7314875.1 selenocysteine-specific translation elongation factor [Chloroflexota bacterium]
MFVIGTAGHVDHGKSALVRALSGINPDRLREEQERGMTIDLGFAWMTLPSGREVSIVDVPGHEDFIKNMLAGIGGIDMALLVVAADESVMPQTREHLAILDLLGISQGVVALTKCDLVEDPEWLALVQEEVRETLVGTTLEGAPIIPVSAVRGDGFEALLAALDATLDRATPRRDLGRPRLPIDRVFTIAGFGTVVTGTLSDGSLRVGEEVIIQPGEIKARIRGLQSHRTRVEEVRPGARVAANLVGPSTEDLYRGQVLSRPGTFRPTQWIDAQVRLLREVPWPLKHNAMVDFYSGAARVPARLRLLDAEALQPGQVGWAQFVLQEPIVVARGDRFVMRLSSPSMTLGGGVVIQPHPTRRYKRFRPEVIATLEALARGNPEEVLLHQAGQGIIALGAWLKGSGLGDEAALAAAKALVERGEVILLAEGWPENPLQSTVGVLSRATWQALMARAEEELRAYHARYPLRAGMPREEFKSRLGLDGAFLGAFIERAVREGRLGATADEAHLASFTVQLDHAAREAVERTLAAFAANPAQPPALDQVETWLGPDLLQYLIESRRLIRSGEGVLFEQEAFQRMVQTLVAYLQEHGKVTVAEARDLLGTSRKYALALLEEMDRLRLTKRLGDVRVLR